MTAGIENQAASAAAERLSALADGEVDGQASELACGAWKGDAELRRTWHAWHLIGDVLRSEDLASTAKRDRDFLVALRLRLDDEPVVLAPAPLLGSGPLPRRRARWMVPSAVAAGFMLVAGTFVVLGPSSRPTDGPALARQGGAPGFDPAVREASLRQTAATAMPAEMVVVNGRLVRDARLDRYLAAHKQFAGTSALGAPSAFLRSATVETQPR